jgi:hypothetical protein
MQINAVYIPHCKHSKIRKRSSQMHMYCVFSYYPWDSGPISPDDRVSRWWASSKRHVVLRWSFASCLLPNFSKSSAERRREFPAGTRQTGPTDSTSGRSSPDCTHFPVQSWLHAFPPFFHAALAACTYTLSSRTYL